MRYYYRGSTLLIRFKTKEMTDRQTITGYDIGATIMGYEGVVDAIDNYSFNVTFDEAITATLPEGHTPIVLSLTKDGVTALGQVKGLAAVEPSINETCGVTDIVTCEVTIEDVTLNYGMVFNNVVTYQDLTDEQKTAMMAGIQSDADELFAELGQTIIDGNLAVDALEAKIPVANAAILAANNAAELATTKAGIAQDAADLANDKANLANTKATLAQESADLANEVATHPPVITEGTWHYWDALTNAYVDTNIAATPYENYLQNTTDNPPLTEAQWSVWSKEQGDYAKEQGDYAKDIGDTYDAAKVDKTSIVNTLTETTAGKVLDARQGKVLNDGVYNTEEVTAQSLVELKERIDALEELIKQGILNNIIIKTLSVEDLQLNGASLILTGANAPAVTPDFIGQFYIKTTATTACYQSTGTSAVGDWKQIG